MITTTTTKQTSKQTNNKNIYYNHNNNDNNNNQEYSIDSMRKGDRTRFLNNSNDTNIIPNCYCKTLSDDRCDQRIVMFAARDIKFDEELIFNYGKMFVQPVK